MRVYQALLQAFAWASAVLVGAMALAVTFDVVARNLGWANTGWVVEVSEYSLPVATLLIAAADDNTGGAPAGEQAGDCFAQSLGATGNDGILSGELIGKI